MMAEIKTEGDLSQISEIQLQYVQKVVADLGYTNSKVTFERIGNYVLNEKKITIEDDKGIKLKMKAKIAPKTDKMRKMGSVERVFNNVHIMHGKVLPKFTQLEVSADIPPEERLRYVTCYGSSGQAPDEVILLEDLTESFTSFTKFDLLKPLSSDCIKSVLKNFAIFHSLSYILRHKEPEIFDEYTNNFIDYWGSLKGQGETLDFFRIMENIALRFAKDDVHRMNIYGAIRNAVNNIVKITNFDKDSKHSVILYGEPWTKSLMFKFDVGIVMESIMADYEHARLGSPAADILHMILNSTNHKMRKDHYFDWIDYYHRELDKSLTKHDLDVSSFLSRDELDAELRRNGKVIFGQSILKISHQSLQVNVPNEELVTNDAIESADPEVEEQKATGRVTKNSYVLGALQKKVEDLVDSCREFGLI